MKNIHFSNLDDLSIMDNPQKKEKQPVRKFVLLVGGLTSLLLYFNFYHHEIEKLDSDFMKPLGPDKISLKNLFVTTAFAVQSAGKQIFRHRDLTNFTYIERNSFLTMKGILASHFPQVALRSEYENGDFSKHEDDVSRMSSEHLPKEFVSKLQGVSYIIFVATVGVLTIKKLTFI